MECFSRFLKTNSFDRIRLGTATCVVILAKVGGEWPSGKQKREEIGCWWAIYVISILTSSTQLPIILATAGHTLAILFLTPFSPLSKMPAVVDLLAIYNLNALMSLQSVYNSVLISFSDFLYSLLVFIPLLISCYFHAAQFFSSKKKKKAFFICISHKAPFSKEFLLMSYDILFLQPCFN